MLEVSDGAGGWVGIDQASGGSGLLDLLGLFGSGTTAQIDGLAAGEYRFTLSLDPNLVAIGATATASLSVDNKSLTDFTVEPGADVEGNVITDPGFNGEPDSTGPLGDATVQVEVDGVFVDADATVGTVLQGLYGELTIFANGDYSYTPNGDIANIGLVDSFAYQLITAAGAVASANLYIRIDSNDTTIDWSPTDPSAPGVVDVVATDDIGTAQIDIDNLVDTQSMTALSYTPPVLIGNGTDTGDVFTVVADTTAELAISRSFSGIGLLPTTTIELQKLIDGTWTTQQTTTAATHTFTGLDAGEYRVTASTGALVSLGTVTITQTLATTHLTEFVTGAAVAATGNVLELSDLSPADSLGSTLTVLTVLSNGDYVIPGQTGAVVQGLYGTLTLQADGAYSYTPTPGLAVADIGQVDSFTYKLTTPGGQEDTATLYVRLDSPDSDLIWDDANPGSPATEGAGFAAASIVDQAASGDDSAGSEGIADSGSDHSVAVDGTDFTHVDSGAGADGLLWEGGDAAINLADLIGKASSVDSIDLNDVSAVELTLSLEDLVSIADPESDRLMIQGDDQDSVHLTGNWSAGATEVENGLEYVIYTSQEDETHHLWVQSGISVV
ncbi:hypothetical protein GIR22_20425 [Pseudomonas sp. CCM 7891]|uniref:VCBS repeat-containing protein n=1 Tax=Pseudomonas karstica TaxID=1055468 RepID=A0A7X2V0P5_9PSED|nr:hypothetical protein [Pseudomonas karstica]